MIQNENQAQFSGNAPTEVDHLQANEDVPENLKYTTKLDDRSIYVYLSLQSYRSI